MPRPGVGRERPKPYTHTVLSCVVVGVGTRTTSREREKIAPLMASPRKREKVSRPESISTVVAIFEGAVSLVFFCRDVYQTLVTAISHFVFEDRGYVHKLVLRLLAKLSTGSTKRVSTKTE